ncbi:unnamed protein product, partial [Chrysoparadoxa australica]
MAKAKAKQGDTNKEKGRGEEESSALEADVDMKDAEPEGRANLASATTSTSASASGASAEDTPEGGAGHKGKGKPGEKSETEEGDGEGEEARSSAGGDEPVKGRKRKRGDPYPLMGLDAEQWVDKIVSINSGRLQGHPGKVLRSGNGWVQLQTIVGEIAKRAYELDLLDDDAVEPSAYTPVWDANPVALQTQAALKAKEEQDKE